MVDVLKAFPISGITCSTVLNVAAEPEKKWILKNIETLADLPAYRLYDLWKQVQTRPVILTTTELCDALSLASQIITLDVRLVENLAIELWIEDGVTFECHLG